MLKGSWQEALGCSKRDIILVFVLLINTFTWYYSTLTQIDSILANPGLSPVLWVVYYSAVAISSVIGAVAFQGRANRILFLYLWMIIGAFSSIVPVFLFDITVVNASLVLVLLGFAFGFGMPSSLGYFADCTTVQNRGRLSGITFLVTNVSVIPIVVLSTQLGLPAYSLTAAAWRAVGFLIFYALRPKEKTSLEVRKTAAFRRVFNDRVFVLYVIPWFLFAFVDRVETPLLGTVGRDFYNEILVLRPVIAGISALAGGLIADTIGRKRIVIYGFIALGLSYGAIGIAPASAIAWYFFKLVESVAAGILWVMFILTLWGDLSPPGKREEYYVIGNLPFSLASIPPLLLDSYITSLSASAAFSLASLFLFASVLPLMYAPETLPEKIIETKRLQDYLQRAKKYAQKTRSEAK